MIAVAPPKPPLTGGLILQWRLRSSTTSWAGRTFTFAPISSSVVPPDIGGRHDHTDVGAPKSKGGSGGGALRGSDVLLAIQKAVARKEGGGGDGVQRSGRKGKKWRGSKSRGEMNLPLPAEHDHGSVRPIEIRGDWEPRIDDLDRRIQELRSRYHF